MRLIKFCFGALFLLVLIWAGFKLFPSNETQILNRLQELAETVSIQPDDGNITRVFKSEKLPGFFSPDMVLQVELEPWEREAEPIMKPTDLSQSYLAAVTRSGINALEVRIVDVLPKIAPDKQTATVLATAIVRVNTQREPVAQELKMELEKVQGRWLIKRLDAIRTLQ